MRRALMVDQKSNVECEGPSREGGVKRTSGIQLEALENLKPVTQNKPPDFRSFAFPVMLARIDGAKPNCSPAAPGVDSVSLSIKLLETMGCSANRSSLSISWSDGAAMACNWIVIRNAKAGRHAIQSPLFVLVGKGVEGGGERMMMLIDRQIFLSGLMTMTR